MVITGLGGEHKISQCLFKDNHAQNGGAIHVAGLVESFQITDCLFINNTATNFGGAILFANESRFFSFDNLTSIRRQFSRFNHRILF